MTVKEILSAHLKKGGFDGLYEPRIECGCRITDLMPCDGAQDTCQPGYLAAAEIHSDVWMIGPKRGTPEELKKIRDYDAELARLRAERGGH